VVIKASQNPQELDRGKRFEFLLQQTEIFSHFMSGNKGEKSTASPQKGKPGRPKKATESRESRISEPDPEPDTSDGAAGE
jgi:SWI/SNF-related matrix-associated actin-dependent regulator of chromatin subfamily A member 5